MKEINLKTLSAAYRRAKRCRVNTRSDLEDSETSEVVRQPIHFDSSHGSDCECAASDGDDLGKIVRRWDDGFGE